MGNDYYLQSLSSQDDFATGTSLSESSQYSGRGHPLCEVENFVGGTEHVHTYRLLVWVKIIRSCARKERNAIWRMRMVSLTTHEALSSSLSSRLSVCLLLLPS